MDNGLSDRRADRRFEIVGRMWAALEVRAEASLRNVSLGGALVDAPRGHLWSSVRTVAITLREGAPPVTGIVTRISPDPDDAASLLVALQFVHLSATAMTEIERLVGEWTD